MASVLPVLVSAAPQLFQLWQGMDAPAQRQLLVVGKQFLPLLGLTDEVMAKMVTVLDEDGDLVSKVMRMSADPEIAAALQAKMASKPAPELREIGVSCPNCKQIKYIHV